MSRPRFTISRHICSDSPRKWWAVFDNYAGNIRARFMPCVLRSTRKAAENYVAELWREIRRERAFNRRRAIREANALKLSRAPLNLTNTPAKARKWLASQSHRAT